MSNNVKFVVPIHDDKVYNDILGSSISKLGSGVIEITNSNPNINESIYTKYQTGVETIKSSDFSDDDIIVFAHEDVGIVDDNFIEKVNMIFDKKKDVGLVGIMGTTVLEESCAWWQTSENNLRGHLVQGNGSPSNRGDYLKKGKIGFFDDLVAIDGCIMITTAKVVKEHINFDLDTFEFYNDFYNLEMCMQILEARYKIAVADIFIFHKSTSNGYLSESWIEAKDKFKNKCLDKGYTFPLTVEKIKER